MSSRPHFFIIVLAGVVIIGAAAYAVSFDQTHIVATSTTTNTPLTQTAATVEPIPITIVHGVIQTATTTATSSTAIASTTSSKSPIIKRSHTIPKSQPAPAATHTDSTTLPQVTRIENPYNTSPESFDTVNVAAREALVNILCISKTGSASGLVSGSGVIIDPRGIILTNAHVAQYVLLSQDPDVNLRCFIRTGAPAKDEWTAQVLYIPPVWVQAHAAELNVTHPTGTGEHDYALLLVNGIAQGGSLPRVFPSVPIDTRDGIGFVGDQVIGASYPAEFLSGMIAENDLYPVSSVSPIDQLLTFGTTTVDVVSIGGVVEAQGGSSGGAVLNAWGRLIGIITTTSAASTTAGRDLRALTLSYINRDIALQTGSNLNDYLSSDVVSEAATFNATVAPELIQHYIPVISQ
ncbi:MAG TPA: trypsin-like peptidase domain-containing protein [Candidatus Paceibacterota bacterium]|nr:trypsin-like peptidase domain-containing protein [Candidatus Paceibacterota bacterium]